MVKEGGRGRRKMEGSERGERAERVPLSDRERDREEPCRRGFYVDFGKGTRLWSLFSEGRSRRQRTEIFLNYSSRSTPPLPPASSTGHGHQGTTSSAEEFTSPVGRERPTVHTGCFVERSRSSCSWSPVKAPFSITTKGGPRDFGEDFSLTPRGGGQESKTHPCWIRPRLSGTVDDQGGTNCGSSPRYERATGIWVRPLFRWEGGREG